MRILARAGVFFCALVLLGAGVVPAGAGGLTFEERVQAEEAIERVAYSHQEGRTLPFEEAVPHEAIETKVRASLAASAALAQLWSSPVTAEMLWAETARMARATRMPERLEEIYRALGNDPVLVQECLARPVLVDRIARSLYASDDRFQGEARSEAEHIRRSLLAGEIDPRARHPRRTRVDVDSGASPSRGPARIGEPTPVRETRAALTIDVLLEQGRGHAVVARYAVPKASWDEYVQDRLQELDAVPIETVAEVRPLPVPAEAPTPSQPEGAPACAPDDLWQHGSLDVLPDPRSRHSAVWTGDVMIVWGGDPLTQTGGRYDPLTNTWSETSLEGAPSPRRDHTAVWTGTRMIVWGGSDGISSFDDGASYDPLTDLWSPISTVDAPSARSGHTAVWTGTRMVVWGGADDSTTVATGAVYDPSSDTWTPMTDEGAPAARAGHTAVWIGSRMLVCGGTDGASALATCSRYDPVADAWTATASMSQARAYHSAVWTGTSLIVWGGLVNELTVLDTGEAYDPAGNTWSNTGLTSFGGRRAHHTAVWSGRFMVVWGGWYRDSTGRAVYLNDGGRYDATLKSWSILSVASAPSNRAFHTAVWGGSRMFVWGGTNGNAADSGGRYDPVANNWFGLANGTAPSQRFNHTAVWTGSQMVVWGGTDGFTRLADGSRYDPATDSWQPVTTNGAPSAREGHTAAWTGTQMVVWGGANGSTLLGNGARYNPVTDTWTTVSATNAPAARTRHTIVWTGDTMIVWGGQGASGALRSGAKYLPASDTWVGTALGAAPTARSRHTAIWTGSRMVVWGGFGTAYLGDGGRYDPATDTWTPTSATGSPTARADHTAVWTGTRMIVWGGMDGASYLGTGGKYDPTADAWASVATAHAPSPRRFHTAVWTGALMVVWGGNDAAAGIGARYHPAGNTWTPIVATGRPAGRASHTAVWTGSKMLVWGGNNSGGALDTGASYAPGAKLDGDLDNICDSVDNCPLIANARQVDSDADGLGDLCDSLRFDFAPAASSAAAGFVKDDGTPFTSARGYGWDGSLGTRERTTAFPIELDTFVFTKPARTWTAEVPNGDYDVRVVAGDASFAEGPNRIVVAGVTAIDDVLTNPGSFVESTVRASVRDGRLSVAVGGTTGYTAFPLLEATATETGPAFLRSIDFQPPASATPIGFLADKGLLFDAARGYGWNAGVGSRERGRPIPQVLDTFIFTAGLRTWELVVPNGSYDVRIGVGDASFPEGPQRLVVEGTVLVNNETTAAGVFLERTVRVTVSDGRLTVDAGGAGGNTAIDYIVVGSAGP